MRSPRSIPLVAALLLGSAALVAALSHSVPSAQAEASNERSSLASGFGDDALASLDATLSGLPGYRDVGFASRPGPHVAVLWDGDVPREAPMEIHATLSTRHYPHGSLPGAPPEARAVPVSHGMWIPYMQAYAQDVRLGIRPGTWMEAPSGCTTSFVLTDSAGALYITTAGHCVDDGSTRLNLFRQGLVGDIVAYQNGGVGWDWAVVRIDEERYPDVSATMQGWRGPNGIATSVPLLLSSQGIPQPTLVKHYGWGYQTWFTPETRCRAAGLAYFGLRSYGYDGHIANGDSGSPSILGDGRALGINTHSSGVPLQGYALGTRMTWAIQRAELATGLDFSLADGGQVLSACSREA